MDKKKDAIGNAFIAMNLIGQSPPFKEAIRKIKKISRFDIGVYIYGETGTGKELAARAIHYLSSRFNRPFVPVSCGGLNDDLILNDLFGHTKGAYTGADRDQPGMIQIADTGTLFIDEIDSLSPKAQTALLRFIQEKEFKLLGSSEIKRADTRIICASNRALEKCVEAGTFRRDLYYRLDILRVDLPPLRQRREDILLLARHFINIYSQEFNLGEINIDAGMAEKIMANRWPGNVRELENYILKYCLLSETVEHLESLAGPPLAEGSIVDEIYLQEGFKMAKARAVNRFEKHYLRVLLTKAKGNISHAARIAKKERRTFTRLLKKHGLCRDDFTPSLQKLEGSSV
jgi:DNA-binding NtrC family response regulator